ncbi:M56 family metallopeptidase [Pleionea sp. CnH1-48]|uniref:M56 family metallopeptidase n=1 Tax=Pleionea sp. CnH1-48 TaxID=2954494 RepID=UPI00209762E3|nr:M56 family metallopeptidase [Pleionea sp. CnH1-48]MCO7224358.1 TonB family protein [Pleionea sp. CnH1-48]
MSNEIVELIYAKVVGLSFVLIAILLIRPLILKKMNVGIAYQLWLAVPVFLLLPNYDFSQVEAANTLTVYLSPEVSLPKLEPVLQNYSIDMFSWLMLVWCIGFIFTFSSYIARYIKLSHSLVESNFTPSNNQLKNALIQADTKFKFVETPLVNSPAVFGCIKAFIILPTGFSNLSDKQQEIILSHELYHLKRRDHQINQVRNFVRCLFWFNPLIYVADKYFEADQEMSCDLGVLSSSQTISPKQYASALLDEAVAQSKTTLLSQWNYVFLIKERIKMIGKNRNKFWHKWIVAIFAFTSIGYASIIVAKSSHSALEAEPLNFVYPRYPIKAAKAGIEGKIKFQFDLTNEGKPVNIKILESVPEGVFDKDASNAFNQWTFDVSKHAKTGLVYTLDFKLPRNAIPVTVVNPAYPREAAKSGVEGSVQFKFDLSDKGHPINIEITESKPKGVFDTPALHAVKQWTFRGPLEISTDLIYTMEFTLGSGGKDSKESYLKEKMLRELKVELRDIESKKRDNIALLNKKKQSGEHEIVKSVENLIAQLDEMAAEINKEIERLE